MSLLRKLTRTRSQSGRNHCFSTRWLRHFRSDSKNYDEVLGLLDSLISFARGNNVKVLLITLPAYKMYRENLMRKSLVSR